MSNPKDILKLNDEELVALRIATLYKQEELEAQRKEIDQLLIEKMTKKGVNAEVVLDHEVKHIHKENLNVSVEEAREYGATKMKEVVDTEQLKKIDAKLPEGSKMPKKIIDYIQIKPLEE